MIVFPHLNGLTPLFLHSSLCAACGTEKDMMATEISRPFLRWAGSKRKLLPRLSPYWHRGFKRYVEPFMGSAALFYAIKPSSALLSDINEELIATFVTVRDHPRAVYNRLTKIPKGKRSYGRLRSIDPSTLSTLDRAARFIFLNRFCFNGIYRTNTAGVFNVPYSPSGTGTLPSWKDFFVTTRSLKSANILCADFEKVINRYVRKGDFVYLDPPYAVKNRRIFRQYGPQTFGLEDLRRLRKSLKTISGRGAKFVLSYAYCPEALKYFRNWKSSKVFIQRNISGFAEHRRIAAELIVTNI